MTENEIIAHLACWCDTREYPFQMPRSFIYGWESDYWSMTASGVTREYEIKISRADYFKDAKKHKHSDINQGANFFYYVCPKDLIRKEEVDSKYGLIYVSKYGSISIVKRPLKLNDRRYDDWRSLAVRMYWKWYRLWREKLKLGVITQEQYLESLKNFNKE